MPGGNVDCVRLLLDHGAITDTSDIKAQTPLFLALRNQHLKVARILLMHGASPDGDLANAATPLCHAAWHGHNEVIKVRSSIKASIFYQEERLFYYLEIIKMYKEGQI